MLADTDHPAAPYMLLNGQPFPRHRFLEVAVENGKKVALYPHGANPILDYDGLREPAPWVSVQFVHGQGHKDLYDLIGLDRRVEVIGWTYSEMTDTTGEGVLFAPIHPWANGQGILPIHREANARAYRRFLKYDGERVATLWGEDRPNGVTHRPRGITFHESTLLTPLDLIDAVDHVIAAGTLAYTALARGKTLDLIDDGLPMMSDDGEQTVAHWDEIKPLIAYDGSEEWKRKWVGEPFHVERFLEILKEIA